MVPGRLRYRCALFPSTKCPLSYSNSDDSIDAMNTAFKVSEKGGTIRRDVAWCAADGHFFSGDPAWPVFLEWLEAFRRDGIRNLVLLGDIFNVWVGFPGAMTPEQQELLRILTSLVSEGRRVVYLLGNRDYYLEDPMDRAGVLVRESWELETGPVRIRFEHGDLINHSDNRYLRWRLFSRSAALKALVGHLPAGLQRKLAETLEGGMAGTNLTYKHYEPSDELRLWAGRLKESGIGRVVLGHFHLDAARRIEGLPVRFVPQFREEGMHLRIDATGKERAEAFGKN